MLKLYDAARGRESIEIGQCDIIELRSKGDSSLFQFSPNNVDNFGVRIYGLMVPEGQSFTPAGAPNQYTPAIDRENMELIIRTLVHMLGGAVTLSKIDVENANRTLKPIQASQQADPAMLILKTEDK